MKEEYSYGTQSPEMNGDFQNGKKPKGKITSSTWFCVLMLIFFFPVGLFVMWKHKKFNIIARIVITALFVLPVIAAIAGGGSEKAPNQPEKNPPPAQSQKQEEVVKNQEENPPKEEPAEETPDIELKTDFEKAVWKKVKEQGAKLSSIETISGGEGKGDSIVAALLCENSEDVVDSLLGEIATMITEDGAIEGMIVTIGDIKEGDDAAVLAMASISSEGVVDINSMSLDYNSARNRWIRGQFSVWDGSHNDLEKLIIKNLNDEKSYKHIETTYRDIRSESVRDEVNKILSDAGYSNRVEIGDLFIQTKFSAKNGFGGTIKSVAFGISSYANNSITLIAIE